MMDFLNRQMQRFAKISLIIVTTVFLFVGVAHPAIAFGNSNSSPSEGTAQMNNLQETSRRAVKQEPRSRQEVQNQAQRGPNEVQGDADLQGMNSQSNSQETTTVRKQVERALENVTPGN